MDSNVLDAKQECNPAKTHSQLWPPQLVNPHSQIVQHFVKLVGTWDVKAKQVFHLQQKLIVCGTVSRLASVVLNFESLKGQDTVGEQVPLQNV